MVTGIPGIYSQTLEEYWIAGKPDNQSLEGVMQEMKVFSEQYERNFVLPPFLLIPFAVFYAKEHMEETLGRWIQNICNLQQPFMVSLNNFSSIPPHTIYFRIQDLQPFIQLGRRFKILDVFNESNHCPPVQLIQKPGLILAEGLPEAVYHSAVHEYSGKTFHSTFRMEKLVLIKKDWKQNGRLVNTFNFPSGHSN